MNLWIAIGGLTLVVVLPMLWPLLRPGKAAIDRLDHDLEVYRDQLREVDAELAADALTEREAGEAKREIERRILRAADHAKSAAGPIAPSALTAVLIALLLPALTLLLYSQIGQPSQPDQPLAARNVAADTPQTLSGGENDEIRDMVSRLAKRLQEQPDDLDGWTLLGRSRSALGRYDEAANALRKAVMLSDGDAGLLIAFGDVLTKGAGGTIPPEALVAFTKAGELAPGNLAARYFLALADLQGGRPQKAYDAWFDLYRALPENGDNRQALAEQIRRVARQLGLNPEKRLAAAAPRDGTPFTAPSTARPSRPPMSAAPGPDRAAVANAAKLSPSERQEFIRSMVQRLADRLQDEPEDFDGWMRLGKAYGVLQKQDESAQAYGRAAALRPGDSGPLNAQAKALIEAAPSGQAMLEQTLTVLRKLEELQPNNSRALWFLGMADAGAGRRGAAIARWRRLFDQLPKQSKQRADLKAAIDRLEAAE